MDEQPPKTSARRFTKKWVALYVAVVFFATVIGLVVANYDSTPMPVYDGKTVREWMREIGGTNNEDAVHAFREMGSNAVPFLAHELARKDSALEKFSDWIFPKLPDRIRKLKSWHNLAYSRWFYASVGLSCANSRTAIPSLLPILAEGNEEQQLYALSVLDDLAKSTDTNWIPQLTILLKSKAPGIRLVSAGILGRLDAEAIAIPAMTNLLVSTNSQVAFEAYTVLREIDPDNAKKWHAMLTNAPAGNGNGQQVAPR